MAAPQALVAGVAAEHGLPFVVISAGTRNHFALDLGLNREDPAACPGALADGVELRVDLGLINGQAFVNHASFGTYAEIVKTPAYRGDKVGTTLDLLPDLLQGHRRARLAAQVDGTQIEAPQALLVSNNPYRTGDIAGLGLLTIMLTRLDTMSPRTAAVIAAIVQPWTLVAAGAITATQAGLSSAAGLLALMGFCLLATSSFVALELYAVCAPVAASTRLAALQTWLDTYRNQIVIVVCGVLGLWLTGHSLYTLITA